MDGDERRWVMVGDGGVEAFCSVRLSLVVVELGLGQKPGKLI